MKMKSAIALVMALFVLAGCSRQGAPEPRFVLQSEGESPQGGFVVRLYADAKAASGQREQQIWVREKGGDSYLLFRFFRIASVVVSPDERWLVVNDRRATSEAGVVLFRRNWRGRFEAVSRPNLDRAAWRRFCQDVGMKKSFPDFDHHYVWCPRWIDGESFAVCLSGYGDGGLVERWKYAYNVRTGALDADPGNSLKYVELNGTP